MQKNRLHLYIDKEVTKKAKIQAINDNERVFSHWVENLIRKELRL